MLCEDKSRAQPEGERLFFLTGKDSAMKNHGFLVYYSPPSFLLLYIIILLPLPLKDLYVGLYLWLAIVTDSKLKFSVDPE